MNTFYLWHRINRCYGFLSIGPAEELPEGVLSLHVLVMPFEFGVVAWWEAADGLFVCFTRVGQA
jgi:hypothetical protein